MADTWLLWALGIAAVVLWSALTAGIVDHWWHGRSIPRGVMAALVWDGLVSVFVRVVSLPGLTADPPDLSGPLVLGLVDRVNLVVCGLWAVLVLLRSRLSWDDDA